MITEHAVCALPDDHRDWRHYALKVKRRGASDFWVIEWSGEYLDLDFGDVHWVGSPGSATRFMEAAALQEAERLAPQLSIRPGQTAADLLNR